MIGLFLCTFICGAEDDRIEEKTLSTNNPTTYEFNASLDNVKAAIKKARGDDWRDAQDAHNGAELIWQSDKNPLARKIFDDPKNLNDAYLCGMGDAVGKSSVYFKNKLPLTYYADFQIHLTSTSALKTRVEIFTFDSHVLAGTELLPFARAGIFLVVEPTTIEEYQILLDIGKQISQSNMPKLMLPDSGIAGKEVTKPRRR